MDYSISFQANEIHPAGQAATVEHSLVPDRPAGCWRRAKGNIIFHRAKKAQGASGKSPFQSSPTWGGG